VKKALYRFPAGEPASAVTAAQARAWAASLSFAPVTIRSHVKILSAFWLWMMRRGYVRTNVFAQIPLPKIADKEPGFLPVEAAQRLFCTVAQQFPETAAYFALGAFAGVRSTACVRLDLDHIRFEQQGILITGDNAKNKRRQFVDGHEPNLWLWLEWAREHAPEGFDLPDRLWQHRRAQAARAAGVTMPHNALRHSFCTYHCALYGDAGKTATLLTHRGNVSMLYDHYKGNAARGDAQAYFEITPQRALNQSSDDLTAE